MQKQFVSIFLLSLLATISLSAQNAVRNGSGENKELGKEEISVTVNALADSVGRYYIDGKIAAKIQTELKTNLKRGAYDKYNDPRSLSLFLSNQLIAWSDDMHFGVDFVAAAANNVQRRMPGNYNHLAPYNFYFNKMEILPGNVGLLEINQFVPPDYTGQLVVAAMNFFSNSDALIIDLRKCIGGDPRAIAQLSGFFFKEPTLLHISHNRAAGTREEFWTTKTTFQASMTGRIAFTTDTQREIKVNYDKLASIPIYILTSNTTFSAAEGIAFGLQTRQRAKTVGATTGRGGNGIRPFALPNGFSVFIPFVEVLSPITGKGYQLTGVLPDIESTPAKALDTAYATALHYLYSKAPDEVSKKRLEWEMRIHKLGQNKNIAGDLKPFAGKFGVREVTWIDGVLYYQREGSTQTQLEPIDRRHFRLDPQTLLQFSDDLNTLTIHQLSGTVNSYLRSSN